MAMLWLSIPDDGADPRTSGQAPDLIQATKNNGSRTIRIRI